jgi:hypothetical protein
MGETNIHTVHLNLQYNTWYVEILLYKFPDDENM